MQSIQNYSGSLQVQNNGNFKHAEFLLFARWMSLPDAGRKEWKLPTQGAFAAKHEISEDTLTLWKKKDEFWKLVDRFTRDWAKQFTPNIIKTLYKRANKVENAHPKDTELWLRYIQGFEDKAVETLKTPKAMFAEDDVRTVIAYLPAEKQKFFYATINQLFAEARKERDRQLMED